MLNEITWPWGGAWLGGATEKINLDKNFLGKSVVFEVKRCRENDSRRYYVKRGGGRWKAVAGTTRTQGDGGQRKKRHVRGSQKKERRKNRIQGLDFTCIRFIRKPIRLMRRRPFTQVYSLMPRDKTITL